MSQPSEMELEEAPPSKTGRTKLIAIIVGVVVAIVAVSGGTIFLLGLRDPCALPAIVPVPGSAGTSPQAVTPLSAAPTRAGYDPSPAQGGTVTVGFTISLTGRFTVEGTNSMRGLLAAENWIDTNGGITVGAETFQVDLKAYDDQSNSANIVNLYTTLVQQDGAQFLLAPYSSALTTAAAPIADQYNRVMMSHGGAADAIWTTTSRQNLVQVLSPASSYLKGSVDWVKANHPTDRIAVIHESDAFSTLAAQTAMTYARSLGLSVVYNASYPTGTTDLSTQLTAAKLACADALIGGGHYADGLLIMNQLKTTWTPRFVSLLVAVTEPDFRAQLQATSNRVVGPSQWESNVAYSPALAQSQGIDWYGPTPAEFTQLYRTMHGGASPSYHSAEAAAALIVLADAIRRAGSLTLDTAAVRAALGSMDIMTFFGEFQIDSRGIQTAHSMILTQWQDGALKIVQPGDVAESPLQYPYTGA